MHNNLIYKGFHAKVALDAKKNLLVAHVIGASDEISVSAGSVEDLVEKFKQAVERHMEQCAADGVSPAKTYSGNIRLRVSPGLHEEVAIKAESCSLSINKWMIKIIQEHI